ncbi:MAG: T9SS type A sorting domain-containing protein [Paludibacter sp.]|nr:T9SS type A sorting domain-containing protein [Paludibacter sp.]
MNTKNLHKKLVAVFICLAMVFATKAQTTALTLSDLQTQFAAAVASGVPSTINIGAAIAVTADLSLVSTGDTITINMVPFGISVTAGTFTIGNKVKITSAFASAGAIQAASGGTVVINAGSNIVSSTGNTVQALTGGTVTVNGGKINTTATAPIVAAGGSVTVNGGTILTNNYPAIAAGMAINTLPTGGSVTINGGYIATSATGIARGIVIDYNGICTVNGGEVRSDMGGGRGISINNTNAGGKLYVNGGTISALGATGRAIQLDNLNSTLWVTGGTITGGLEGIMVQKNGVAVLVGNPTITGTIGTNTTTSKLYDARGLSTPVATPGQGYYATSQNVTVTGGTGTIYKYVNTTALASATTVTSSLVYTTDGTDPVVASTAVSAPITMPIPSVLKVAALIEGATVSPNVAFNYWTIGTPMTAAPNPPAYAAPKVTSIFSEAYPNVAGTDFNPGWGQSGSNTIVQVAGNNTIKMANLNYQGIQFGSPVNALPMSHLHLDVFTSNETSLQVFCISASTGEKFFQLTPLNLNAWNSYDIPLTAFTSQGLGVSDLIQFKFVGSGGKTSYLDNLYFYNSDPTPDTQAPTAFTATKGLVASDAVTLLLNGTDNSGAVNYEITYGTTTLKTSGISGVQKSYQVTSLTGSTDYSFSVVCKDATGNVAANSPIVVTATTLTALPGAPVPTMDAAKVISIFSNTYTSAAPAANYNPNWGQATVQSMVQLSGNDAVKYANLNYQGIDLMTTINVSSMNKLHVDVYPIDETSLQITPISAGPKEKLITLSPLNLNTWNSFDLILSSFTGVDMTTVFQFKFVGAGGKISYIDNLYFFNDVNNGLAKVETAGIKCYPSQVSDRMTVSAESEISLVNVRNLLGQSVKSVVVNGHENTIDLSAVSAGNYFVTVKLANGQSATQKIVKL